MIKKFGSFSTLDSVIFISYSFNDGQNIKLQLLRQAKSQLPLLLMAVFSGAWHHFFLTSVLLCVQSRSYAYCGPNLTAKSSQGTAMLCAT